MIDNTSTEKSLKRRLARVLARAQLACWAVPLRTLRQMSGLRPPVVPLGEAGNILVIRPDEIGDVVLTSPFLRELRRAAPSAHIALLVKTACRELVVHCPYVDAVHALNFAPDGSDGYRVHLRWSAWRLRWSRVPRRGFDLVLLPRRDADWYDAEFVGHLLAGHGVLLVHRDRVVKNCSPSPPDPPFAFEPYSNPHIEHEVLHNLRFLRWCGVPGATDPRLEVWLTDTDRIFARSWLDRHLPCSAPLVVLHPSGGRSPLKQWPHEKFRALLIQLLTEKSCNFLVLGGKEENWIAKEFSCVVSQRTAIAVGEFTLRQLCAILEEAELFVGGDSGPMHLAAAVGTPVIAILGSTSEVRFRPWGSYSQVVSRRYACSPDSLATFENRCQLCRYPEPRCLTELSVESVLAEARALLAPCDSEARYQLLQREGANITES